MLRAQDRSAERRNAAADAAAAAEAASRGRRHQRPVRRPAVDEGGGRQGQAAAPTRPAAKSGVWATPAGDGKGTSRRICRRPDLYDRIAHNLFSINLVWTLVTGFLVMFMQAGFACVETGLCRAKNASHTFAMNLMIYPLGCFAFWAYGFAIGWGNWFNGPVPPGWYASLGPGLTCLNGGIGIEPQSDPDGAPNGVLQVGPVGHQGLFPARRATTSASWPCSSS